MLVFNDKCEIVPSSGELDYSDKPRGMLGGYGKKHVENADRSGDGCVVRVTKTYTHRAIQSRRKTTPAEKSLNLPRPRRSHQLLPHIFHSS